MQMEDTLLQKVVSEIAGREREIVDDFCKAFIAQKSLEGFPISTIFDHYNFCVSHDFSNSMCSKYWFEKKDDQPERLNPETQKKNPFLDEIPECGFSDEMR